MDDVWESLCGCGNDRSAHEVDYDLPCAECRHIADQERRLERLNEDDRRRAWVAPNTPRAIEVSR